MHTISSSFLARILPFVDKLKAFIFYKCLQQSFFIYKLISNRKGQVYSFKPDFFAFNMIFVILFSLAGILLKYGEIS
jgi:hypothetical protein